jgi:CspA family cold shock protein
MMAKRSSCTRQPCLRASVKAGTKLEFGIADGKRGAQALSVRVLEAPPSLQKMARKPADDMAVIIEDLVKVLDSIGSNLKRGRYPDNAHSRKIAALLRKVADELDA